MEGVSKLIKRDPFSREVGKMMNQMGTVERLLQKVKSMMEIGLRIECKEKEFFLIKMEHHILDNGKIITRMVMDSKNIRMGQFTREGF